LKAEIIGSKYFQFKRYGFPAKFEINGSGHIDAENLIADQLMLPLRVQEICALM
jgi:hypothetical protein